MISVKRIVLAGLFIVPVLFVQSAWAGLILPESSYYQGRAFEGSPGDRVRVDFAVYDTEDKEYGNEFENAGFAAPGEGRFTYVYQVFNEIEDEEFSIDLFRIVGIEPGAITGADKTDKISSHDDQEGGIATDLVYFNPSFTNGTWEFEQGALVKGKHSWFLTLSSDSPPTAGDFSIVSDPDGEVPIPVPEPGTMILIGVGSVILMARRKDSLGMSRRR